MSFIQLRKFNLVAISVILVIFCLTSYTNCFAITTSTATSSIEMASSTSATSTIAAELGSTTIDVIKTTVKKEKLPSSFIIFFDYLKERVILLFIFDPVKKAEKRLQYIDKKISLAKGHLLDKQNNPEDQIKALKLISQVDHFLEKVKQSESKWAQKEEDKKKIKDKVNKFDLERKYIKNKGVDKKTVIEKKKKIEESKKTDTATTTTSTVEISTTTADTKKISKKTAEIIKEIEKLPAPKAEPKKPIIVVEKSQTGQQKSKGTTNKVKIEEPKPGKNNEEKSSSTSTTVEKEEAVEDTADYEQFANVYVLYYESIDVALRKMFYSKFYQTFKYELVKFDSSVGENNDIYWLEVKNKRGDIVELAFLLIEKKDGKYMISDIVPRDALIDEEDIDNFTKFVDSVVYQEKIYKKYGNKTMGSNYMSKTLFDSGVDALNTNNSGSADYLFTLALNLAAPKDVEMISIVYSHLAHLYFNTGKSMDKQIAMYNKAIEVLDDSYPTYYALKGIVARKQVDEKNAIIYFNKALELDPNNFQSLQFLGNLYLRAKDKSLRDCNKASQLLYKANIMSNYAINVSLARSYICLNNYVNAAEILETELVSASPYNMSVIFYYLSQAYLGLGKIEAGMQSYIQAVKLDRTLRGSIIENRFCEALKEGKCDFSELD